MALSFSFKGKKALVTGAGRGIGHELCLKLHEDGAQVYALSKSAERLKVLEEKCPGLRTICVDLGDWDATRTAISAIKETMDYLINNAAIAVGNNFMSTTPDNFDALMNVNVKGIINVSQLVAQKMIDGNQGGSIVNVSSLASRFGLAETLSYTLTKACVDMLTKSMAVELGPKNIRVNSVNPGIVITDMTRYFYEEGRGVPVKEKYLSRTPLGRVCETDEVVNTILFLLSDLAPTIHGEQVFIDGGFSNC